LVQKMTGFIEDRAEYPTDDALGTDQSRQPRVIVKTSQKNRKRNTESV
jgi:NADH:ubiquinone oxidoreductase subunit E